MRNYVQLKIQADGADSTLFDILVAELSEQGFEGFLESGQFLEAFIPEEAFHKTGVDHLLARYNPAIHYQVFTIADKNWNAAWEKSFQPVVIGSQVQIRAPFHQSQGPYPHDILITPKMSFGTGHHPTTQLMIEAMLKTTLSNKHVLDFGCGTGILSILASQAGAKEIIALDTEEWACKNAVENFLLNHIQDTDVLQGNLDMVRKEQFELILANINLNTIVLNAAHLGNLTLPDGVLLISGFYENDLEKIDNELNNSGFKQLHKRVKQKWCEAGYYKTGY